MKKIKNQLLWLGIGLVILALLSFAPQLLAKEFSIIKPITAYHYYDRSHPTGKDWNENYLDSIGAGYRHKSGIGAQAIYVNENSINRESVYLHSEYMYSVNSWLSVGGIAGIRTSYTDPVMFSGAGQVELCYDNYCSLFMISDRVSIFNLKYKF